MSRSTCSTKSDASSSYAGTQTSTAEYDQEPFETFRLHVQELASELWDDSIAENILIERLCGGGYNRIIGVSKTPTATDAGFNYVLRIPRFEDSDISKDLAALQYVHNLGGIPVPGIIQFDTGSENKLGKPYMLLHRLPGQDINSHGYSTLNHGEKCRIAKDLGHLYRQMLATTSDIPGILDLKSSSSLSGSVVEPFINADLFEGEILASPSARPSTTPKDWLCYIFETKKNIWLKRWNHHKDSLKIFDDLMAMVADLEADGWFENVPFSLCHTDLEPRNIIFDPSSQSSEPIITGILDWDNALIAPSFNLCKPPVWIWGWMDEPEDPTVDDEKENEKMANYIPPTEEYKALREIFEEAAGPVYMRYAYSSAYRLGRDLIRFAIDGLSASWTEREAAQMVEDWPEMRAALKNTRQQPPTAVQNTESPATQSPQRVEEQCDQRVEQVVVQHVGEVAVQHTEGKHAQPTEQPNAAPIDNHSMSSTAVSQTSSSVTLIPDQQDIQLVGKQGPSPGLLQTWSKGFKNKFARIFLRCFGRRK